MVEHHTVSPSVYLNMKVETLIVMSTTFSILEYSDSHFFIHLTVPSLEAAMQLRVFFENSHWP